MSMSAMAARAAALLLTSEKGRKGVGFLLIAIADMEKNKIRTRCGVLKTKLEGARWTHWLKIPYISYD